MFGVRKLAERILMQGTTHMPSKYATSKFQNLTKAVKLY